MCFNGIYCEKTLWRKKCVFLSICRAILLSSLFPHVHNRRQTLDFWRIGALLFLLEVSLNVHLDGFSPIFETVMQKKRMPWKWRLCVRTHFYLMLSSFFFAHFCKVNCVVCPARDTFHDLRKTAGAEYSLVRK